ncbi:MAG: glycosyltransferase [Alphaproteobacteria bacterium]|nr:glycosyltransferase [Alphaproteobacteria bacterium]
MPAISVVMPVYNVERFVRAAIDSVLNQSFEDFELLIIDDGGTDRSIDICREYVDPRVRIISQKNRGLAGARNTGIRYARADIIAFLDSDDLWHLDKLARHLDHLHNNPDIGVSFSGAHLIDDDGHDLGIDQTPKLRNIEPQDIFLRNPVSNGSTPVIRRQVFTEIARPSPDHPGEDVWFDESLRQSEDIDCWLQIALSTSWKFEGIPGPLTLYRVNAGGLSANVVKQFESWLYVRDKVRDLAPDFAHRWEATAEAFQLRYLARRAVRMRDRGLAFDLAIAALKRAPNVLIREPLKTSVTLLAALALRLMPTHLYGRLEGAVLARAGSA